MATRQFLAIAFLSGLLAAPPGARAIDLRTVPSAAALERRVLASGDGWVRQRFTGAAGAIAYTDAAEYFFVSDLAGIDAVPLEQVIGAEFAGFVRGQMRANALATTDPAQRTYVIQAAALRAAEPLWLDREQIELDPYGHLDVTICVPMPAVGGIAEPTFSPDIVIREITSGVLEYHEALDLGANLDLVRNLGRVDLRLASASLAQPALGGAPAGAVAQSASAGGLSCFKLSDILRAGDGDASCKVDLLRPDTWYREYDLTGSVDMKLPTASNQFSIDTTQGAAAMTPLANYYQGRLRYESEYRFQNEQGRGIGGSLRMKLGTFFCVPLWLRPDAGRLWAHVNASARFEMNGTLLAPASDVGQVVTEGAARTPGILRESDATWNGTPASTLPDPRSLLEEALPNPLMLVVPMPPPVPIVLILDLPVEVGLIAGIESPALTNFSVERELRIGFDYSCGFDGGCREMEPTELVGTLGGEMTGDAGIEGRGFVKPYLGLSARVSLYLPGAVYAKVGPRIYANLDLWGASKFCGDADGNGAQEWLNAIVLDADTGLETVAEVGIFELLPSGSELIDGLLAGVSKSWVIPGLSSHWHLILAKYGDGADPFQPMLAAPTSVQEDTPATLGARMRPCYPYSDRVDYTLRYGDGQQAGPSGAPGSDASSSHAWANPGNYSLELSAVRDSHGREFGAAMGTPPMTRVSRPLTVTARPVIKQPVPTRPAIKVPLR